MILYTTNQDISQECRCFEYTFTNNTLPLHSENRTNHNLMLNQRHHPVITLLAVIMISVFSCQNTRIKQISDNAPILSLQLASSIHNNAVPDDEELDTLSEVTDISALQAQNKLLRQRSHFTTGGIAMILGVGAILVFLMLNSRWNRTLEIKNQQLERERNIVLAQNKQLEIERDHAEAASKAKTSFMQSMTHEIRTPLNSISGFTQVLTIPGIDLPEGDRLDLCQRIQDNTRQLTNILDDLILISDMESRTELEAPEVCLASSLATQAADAIRPLVVNGVTFECTNDLPEERMITTHPQMIHTVLNKLLDNAAKFTKEGSISLTLSEEGNHLHFTVKDSGPGIPADKREEIFQRFVKLDNFTQGTGLGLTIARMIAERLGGTLTLDPNYTGGAKFDFIVPIAA